MADPGNQALGVHQERTGNPVPARRHHPALGHFTLLAAGLVIERDAVSHLVAHRLHERRHQTVVPFPAVLPDDNQAFLVVLVVYLVQMRDRRPAWATPGGPEFDQISLLFTQLAHLIAL